MQIYSICLRMYEHRITFRIITFIEYISIQKMFDFGSTGGEDSRREYQQLQLIALAKLAISFRI